MMEIDRKLEKIINILKDSRDTSGIFLHYVLPLEFSKTLGSYLLIRQDLNHTIDALRKLIILKKKGMSEQVWDYDETIEESLWFSAIIHYAKCFNSNKGGHSFLNIGDIVKEDKKIIDFHKQIIDIRNTYISHRDSTEFEQTVVLMQIPREGEIGTHVKYITRSLKDISQNLEDLNLFIELIEMVLVSVKIKTQKETNKVSKLFYEKCEAGLIKAVPIEYFNFD